MDFKDINQKEEDAILDAMDEAKLHADTAADYQKLFIDELSRATTETAVDVNSVRVPEVPKDYIVPEPSRNAETVPGNLCSYAPPTGVENTLKAIEMLDNALARDGMQIGKDGKFERVAPTPAYPVKFVPTVNSLKEVNMLAAWSDMLAENIPFDKMPTYDKPVPHHVYHCAGNTYTYSAIRMKPIVSPNCTCICKVRNSMSLGIPWIGPWCVVHAKQYASACVVLKHKPCTHGKNILCRQVPFPRVPGLSDDSGTLCFLDSAGSIAPWTRMLKDLVSINNVYSHLVHVVNSVVCMDLGAAEDTTDPRFAVLWPLKILPCFQMQPTLASEFNIHDAVAHLAMKEHNISLSRTPCGCTWKRTKKTLYIWVVWCGDLLSVGGAAMPWDSFGWCSLDDVAEVDKIALDCYMQWFNRRVSGGSRTSVDRRGQSV
jgi:hypothetical protein